MKRSRLDAPLIGATVAVGLALAVHLGRQGRTEWALTIGALSLGWGVLMWITWRAITRPPTTPEAEEETEAGDEDQRSARRITLPWQSDPEPDTIPDTPAGLDRPGPVEAGRAAGEQVYGPGHLEEGTIYSRPDPAGWEHPTWTPPVCPHCRARRGLWLIWLDLRPELGRVACEHCGTAWEHTSWCRPPGAAYALDQVYGPVRVSEGQDTDPLVAYWGAVIRCQAGNPDRVRKRGSAR